jgi:rhodanese-related sulfurtransferase
MHESLFEKILPLSDSLLIYPGHGAGSLCGKSIGAVRSTTIGFERRHNPALNLQPRESFVDFAVAGLPEQPANVGDIKAMNRRGPRPLGDVAPRPVTIEQAIPYFQSGAALLDLRGKEEYKTLHIPGSVHLELDDQLSNRIGFTLPAGTPIVLMLSETALPDQAAAYRRAVYALARVGFDQVVGYLSEDLTVWQDYGLPTASGDIRDITPSELQSLLDTGNGQMPVVLDVRESWEFAQGRVPGAILIPLGELAGRVDELDPAVPVAIICATGSRSTSAAALLGRRGFEKIYNVVGGTMNWMRSGLPLER